MCDPPLHLATSRLGKTEVTSSPSMFVGTEFFPVFTATPMLTQRKARRRVGVILVGPRVQPPPPLAGHDSGRVAAARWSIVLNWQVPPDVDGAVQTWTKKPLPIGADTRARALPRIGCGPGTRTAELKPGEPPRRSSSAIATAKP